MIALIMFLLLWFGKNFGMSENFRVMCAADGADEMNEFFKINWRDQEWNLLVALGAVLAAIWLRTILRRRMGPWRTCRQSLLGACVAWASN